MSMKTKGVSFNIADPDQKALMEFAESYPNFSGYIKRLIQSDKEQKERARVIRPANGGGIRINLNDQTL